MDDHLTYSIYSDGGPVQMITVRSRHGGHLGGPQTVKSRNVHFISVEEAKYYLLQDKAICLEWVKTNKHGRLHYN